MSFSFSSCLNCGSFFVTPSKLCQRCSQLLQPLKINQNFYAQDLMVKALYQWPPGVSDTLSSLILSMKIAELKSWEFYAQEFCSQWASQFENRKIVLVTMTSSSGRRHAQHWAEALQKILGCPHIEALKIANQPGEQKELSLKSRSSRVLIKDVEFSPCAESLVVFADDVLTTGFTALAAYKALGSPKNFQVWCMAWRPPSSVAASHRAW